MSKHPEVVVLATEVAPGAIVTGFAVSATQPPNNPHHVVSCEPIKLARIYTGYGKLRAESAASSKGFGTLISDAEIDLTGMRGLQLWLRVED